MTRQLESWARSSGQRERPRLTWVSDMWGFATTAFGLRNRRPESAPCKESDGLMRLTLAELRKTPDLLRRLTWRIDYQVVGLDAVSGVQAPVIFAVNEAGALDWSVLRAILPGRLRTTNATPVRALRKGRSVALFSDDPLVEGEVGEFGPLAAQLANQFNVPIIPVALVGTFQLNAVLGLSLRHKPKVSVRFGAPVYVRGRSLEQASAEVQAVVERLFGSGDMSWWAGQRSTAERPPSRPAPRWRRLWQQTAPTTSSGQRRIWDAADRDT